MGGGAAGGTAGGGVAVCNCPGGCCAKGSTTCARGQGLYFTCGEGATCAPGTTGSCGNGNDCASVPPPTGCNILQADRCTPQGCACGMKPCADGLTCGTLFGFGAICVCSPATCNGCCSADAGQCIPLGTTVGTNVDSCGNSGLPCTACARDAGGPLTACTMSGVCGNGTMVCPQGRCASGTFCIDTDGGQFPRCIAPGATACVWCDPFRSDHCAPSSITPCQCGLTGKFCQPGETCTRPQDGGFGTCAPL